MIIALNFGLLMLFLIKSFFLKNEFSLMKTTFKNLIHVFLSCFNLSNRHTLFSLKKLTKIYSCFQLKNNFKHTIHFMLVINQFKTKWILLELFFNTVNSTHKIIFFKPNNLKLNSFLKNQTTEINEFVNDASSNYVITHKPSSLVKYFSKNPLNVLFLRKNKIFNKGRYSRNRQLYRTGVYWCIWLSVFLGYCLYFSFYRFTLNFGYQWWLVFGFFFLFFNQKMFKYHFYNVFIILTELKKNFNWLSIFCHNFSKIFIR